MRIMKSLKGSIVPVVTPFDNNMSIDFAAMKKHIEFLVRNGSHGVCVCGSTGEATSLSLEEKKKIFAFAVENVRASIPVVAGIVSSNISETIELAKSAESFSCSALLIGVPYYSRPNQEGIYDYFARILKTVDLPVIVYNIPSRTSSNMESKTLGRLRKEFSNLVGIKEANRDFEQMNRDILECGKDFLVYSGIESLCFPLLCIGGAGYFSATANILPNELARMYNLYSEGKWEEARKIHFELLPINIALFMDTNPVPLKAALGMLGLINEILRPPLLPLAEEKRSELKTVLEKYNLGVIKQDEES
jgi:4-hydroxy-tetrahydrodipicolinate synthase